MQISIFTDAKYSNLYPLTITRPADDLRSGILTIREKWLAHLQVEKYTRQKNSLFTGLFDENNLDTTEPTYWINSCLLPTPVIIEQIQSLKVGEGIYANEIPLIVLLAPDATQYLLQEELGVPEATNKIEHKEKIRFLRYPWELLKYNAVEISNDLPLFNYPVLRTEEYAGKIFFSNPNNIFVSPTAVIEPGCTIHASQGPVFIGDNAIIESGSFIKGPVAICENAVTKMASRIYEGATIGPVCKVGGEVAHCIFHSYSNKAHDGYAGNSIFGQWCNLGADTNTSNLNNNYSTVKIPDWDSKKLIETGFQFLGTVMGDHSKTSINSMLKTGTMYGVSSNLFMSGFPPKHIQSFSWVDCDNPKIYRLEKALETMVAMMKRRNVELTPAYKAMMQKIFLYSQQKALKAHAV